MWLLSQREFLEVIKPEKLRKEMKETLEKMLQNYQ
jgi:predicted DNA-binding transcriptional regulator YafY